MGDGVKDIGVKDIPADVSAMLDPIQDAAALLDARNPTPFPTLGELRRIEKFLNSALLAVRIRIRASTRAKGGSAK